MDIQLRGHNFELTEANRDYVIDKVSKLNRYFKGEIKATVRAKKFQRSVKLEVMLTGLNNQLHIRAEEIADDYYSSVDLVIEKLEKQIRKYKTRSQKRHQDKLPLADWFLEEKENNRDIDKDFLTSLVREKELELTKPMDVNEAILQMGMLGHNFFIFKEMDTLAISVLYKRTDGLYGLIKVK
ncbi:ribosome hibernation-promoting factor, HPF/YfiA family [Bacillus toyonensis]|uniref:ribosome hibernation-promoting factor, HPF/YfiA family n=1 Tax=Bacillus toyonensis TaxID=155322 RepID=UPI002E1EAE1F|nr:ribosome-associated translation inhibitor RaiA [Bacillus toyonensis]MED2737301.1 ribosome-associated translation inhibitor RaiA [Bacillus toyonensis]